MGAWVGWGGQHVCGHLGGVWVLQLNGLFAAIGYLLILQGWVAGHHGGQHFLHAGGGHHVQYLCGQLWGGGHILQLGFGQGWAAGQYGGQH